jgi:hypothetical protein
MSHKGINLGTVRFCPSCGTEAVSGGSFCGDCGRSLLSPTTASPAADLTAPIPVGVGGGLNPTAAGPTASAGPPPTGPPAPPLVYQTRKGRINPFVWFGIGLAVLLGGGAVAIALSSHSHSGTTSTTQATVNISQQTTQPIATTTQPIATPPLSTSIGDPFVHPPAGQWIAVMASIPHGQGVSAAEQQLSDIAKSVPDAQLLNSDDYSSLRPGYYVVFEGAYSSSDAALAECNAVGRSVPSDCYPRNLS